MTGTSDVTFSANATDGVRWSRGEFDPHQGNCPNGHDCRLAWVEGLDASKTYFAVRLCMSFGCEYAVDSPLLVEPVEDDRTGPDRALTQDELEWLSFDTRDTRWKAHPVTLGDLTGSEYERLAHIPDAATRAIDRIASELVEPDPEPEKCPAGDGLIGHLVTHEIGPLRHFPSKREPGLCDGDGSPWPCGAQLAHEQQIRTGLVDYIAHIADIFSSDPYQAMYDAEELERAAHRLRGLVKALAARSDPTAEGNSSPTPNTTAPASQSTAPSTLS